MHEICANCVSSGALGTAFLLLQPKLFFGVKMGNFFAVDCHLICRFQDIT